MKRAAAFLVLVTLGWLGSGAIADAGGPPQHFFTMPVDETNVLAECDGFQILDHVVGELSVTLFLAKDGAVERVVTDTRGTHYLRNSVSGLAVNSGYHRRFMTNLDAGRTQIVGPAYHLTVPGHGAVLFETGIITFANGTMATHGRHDAMAGDLHRLCPAFA